MVTLTVNKNTLTRLDPNPKRARWTITFTPSSIAAGNTGKIFVGRGFTPNPTVGDPNQGDVLNAGSQIEEKASFPNDPSVFLGPIVFVSDTDGQQITLDEQSFA